jgi:hypothetical protein
MIKMSWWCWWYHGDDAMAMSWRWWCHDDENVTAWWRCHDDDAVMVMMMSWLWRCHHDDDVMMMSWWWWWQNYTQTTNRFRRWKGHILYKLAQCTTSTPGYHHQAMWGLGTNSVLTLDWYNDFRMLMRMWTLDSEFQWIQVIPYKERQVWYLVELNFLR